MVDYLVESARIRTSGTDGTVKLGTPFAKLPKPASEPQAESVNSSSSSTDLALLSSLVGPVVENRFAREFMVGSKVNLPRLWFDASARGVTVLGLGNLSAHVTLLAQLRERERDLN